MALSEPLWKQLREEANSVKDCFTGFTFQALAFSAFMLSAAATYQAKQPLVGLVGVLVIIVLVTVSRIGGHKYSTANRHFAYELYHDTHDQQAAVGWEEAQRAWRVVAPAVFDSLHITQNEFATNGTDGDRRNAKPTFGRRARRALNPFTGWNVERYERGIKQLLEDPEAPPEAVWFHMPKQLGQLTWHPGRYLEMMQGVLHLVAVLSLAPVLVMALQFTPGVSRALSADPPAVSTVPQMGSVVGPSPSAAPADNGEVSSPHWSVTVATWLVFVLTTIKLCVKIRQLEARRLILENGMLSIPGSAIVWHLTMKAHEQAKADSKTRPSRYLGTLAAIAEDITAAIRPSGADKPSYNPGAIWTWIKPLDDAQ